MSTIELRRRSFALALALGLTALPIAGFATAAETGSDCADAVSPAAPSAAPDARGRTNAAFALNLLARQVEAKPGNTVLSPFGVSQVLAALEIGADKQMRAAIAQTLDLTRGKRPADFAALRSTARLLGAVGLEPQSPFKSADGLFVDQRIKLDPKTEERVRSDAALVVRNVDFSKPGAVAAVNQWVRERTNGRIESVLEPGSSPSLAALNAFAFKSCWLHPFDPRSTRAQPFTRLDGSTVQRPMMELHSVTLPFRQSGRFLAVELPYVDERFALTLVTTTDKPAAVGEFRSAAPLLAGRTLAPQLIRLALPKFSHESDGDLLATLSAMGLAPGLASPRQLEGFASGLSLSAVRQRTVVEVDESGTEAASATAAIATRGTPASASILAKIERPYVYALRHKPTGTVLLVGYIADPSPAAARSR